MPGPAATASVKRRAVEPLAVDLIPGLRTVRRLARGGFAEVWEAEQVSLGRRVAVKILRKELLGHAEMVRLFEQEARVLARLNHPNVVQVIDRGTCERGPYFVMEYVAGETLQSLLSKKALSRDRALSILLEAARGLAYAHRNRVVHRDVKPANILVGSSGQVKIGDFGIAAVKAAAGSELAPDSGKKTALGTRAFMAPEQRVSFDKVGPAADVYSLGVVLHRIVTGSLPDKDVGAEAYADFPAPLTKILTKSLSKAADERYSDAGRFREALVNILEGRHLDDRTRRGAASAIGGSGRFELLDVIRQDRWRSVYLVRKGGEGGERIVVKRYVKHGGALKTVRSLMRVEHPHIIRILAVGERDDAFIILMEHLAGGDLRERLVKPHSFRSTAKVGRDVARALGAVHALGIVHGNVRPSNILFDAEGRIRVTDFGLPEHYQDNPAKRNWYAAPEPGVTPGRDLYALGAILFEMLFAAPATDANVRDRLGGAVDPAVPEEMATILRKLLAAPGERYEAAEHVASDLEQLIEGPHLDSLPQTFGLRGEPTAQTARSSTTGLRLGVHGPALLGLAGLAVAWLQQQTWVQEGTARIVARFLQLF